jgi:hypothetical protein
VADVNVRQPLHGAAARLVRDQLREPSDLDVAIGVAHLLLDSGSDNAHALSEALRILLRALDVEVDAGKLPDSGKLSERCPAAHPEDPTDCTGPASVTVTDATNAGADGCEHHAARLLASLAGARVYALPDAPAGAAIRVFKAADSIRPFPWIDDAPRTQPSQLSHAENRNGGERP